jgi:cell division topological specificity factor
VGFFTNLFSANKSGSIAKDRLKVVLLTDRIDISPAMMENLRNDIIAVIKNYVEIDEKHIELDLEKETNTVAIVANIPVMTVKRLRRGNGQ